MKRDFLLGAAIGLCLAAIIATGVVLSLDVEPEATSWLFPSPTKP